MAAAITLIDCGSMLSDLSSVDQGVVYLEEITQEVANNPELAYNLGNGLQCRARLRFGPNSLILGQSVEDLFKARVQFGSVLQDSTASPELRSQAATNIGILL